MLLATDLRWHDFCRISATIADRPAGRDRLYLDRTTVEEVENNHKATLAFVLEDTNKAYGEYVQRARRGRARAIQREEHRRPIEDAAKRIKFD